MLLEFMNLNVNEVNVFLPCLAEAVLELRVIISVHLIALEMYLERCTLLNPLVPYVIEPRMADQFNS